MREGAGIMAALYHSDNDRKIKPKIKIIDAGGGEAGGTDRDTNLIPV